MLSCFTRRRQSNEHYAAKRRSLEPSALSAGNSPIHLSPARSLTYAQERPGPRALSIAGAISNASTPDDASFQCPLCKRNFVEPKVLACLHTFCAKCLEDINKHGSDLSLWNGLPVGSDVTLNGQAEPCNSRSGSGSAGSGYESEPRADSDASWALSERMALKPHSSNKFGIFRRKVSGKNILVLVCPTCGFENRLPQGGVAALPPNFLLQHRMLLAALNKDKSRILCDLCSTDTPAATRCGTCLVNMCAFCGEAHGRQRATSGHGVAALRGGRDIARLRRRVMCAAHPDTELKMFCNTCCQDSPFSGCVRSLRPHTGKYHCCTFCSTGGNKDIECGCGGSMGGGYKGCGHGHNGHPGGRHWSCCGNIQQNSECVRAESTIYQFSL